jgi:hypothetical protein
MPGNKIFNFSENVSISIIAAVAVSSPMIAYSKKQVYKLYLHGIIHTIILRDLF